MNFMTAWVALMEVARMRSTDRVGITAAAGGVGTAATQIAAAYGCHVVGMAGSDEKLVPYVVQPQEITPGISVDYASTCTECPANSTIRSGWAPMRNPHATKV